MSKVISILFKHFMRTMFGPILALVLPTLFLVILGNIYKIQYVFPAIIAFSIIVIGVISVPVSIVVLKNSILLKFVGSTLFPKWKFLLSVAIFYLLVSWFIAISLILSTFIFFKNNVVVDGSVANGLLSGIFSLKGFFSFIAAVTIHSMFAIVIGILIAIITKSILATLSVGVVILIVSLFLTGVVIPVDIIAKSPVLQWMSRFVPFRYSTGNIVVASTPLDQTKNLFMQLSLEEKSILFDKYYFRNNAQWLPLGALPTGVSQADILRNSQVGDVFDKNYHVITSYRQLLSAIDNHDFIPSYMAGDKHLFSSIFQTEDVRNVVGSSSNILNIDPFGVKKVMTAEEIKTFVTSYLSGDSYDSSRYAILYDYIKANNYSWLELFFTFTKTLYFKTDKILNLVIPTVTILIGSWVSVKRFSWNK